MRILDMFAKAMSAFVEEWSAVGADLKAAAREMFDDNKRAAAQSKERHPLGSSTPLPEALYRARKSVARLEKKHQKAIEQAAVGMLAIDHAKALVEHLETATKHHHEAELRKAASGLYEVSRRYIDRMHGCGVSTWHLRQQSQREIEIYSDLAKWKADDAEHENPDSPWPEVLRVFEERDLQASSSGRPAPRSMPKRLPARAAAARGSPGLAVPAAAAALAQAPFSSPAFAPVPTQSTTTMPQSSDLTAAFVADAVPGPSVAPPSTSPPALNSGPDNRADALDGPSDSGPVAGTEAYAAVAEAIVRSEKEWELALWREVGFPGGSKDYEQIARNAKAALAAGSTVPHLREFGEEAGKGYPYLFLKELEEQLTCDLMERLAKDPGLRSHYASMGHIMPGGAGPK